MGPRCAWWRRIRLRGAGALHEVRTARPWRPAGRLSGFGRRVRSVKESQLRLPERLRLVVPASYHRFVERPHEFARGRVRDRPEPGHNGLRALTLREYAEP